MGENNRKPVRGRQPIRRHPLFPAVVGLWVGAVFGLAGFVFPLPVLEAAVRAVHADALIPAAAPPLGGTARMLLILILAAVGIVAGAALARRLFGKGAEDAATPPVDAHAGAIQLAEAGGRRRSFTPAPAVANLDERPVEEAPLGEEFVADATEEIPADTAVPAEDAELSEMADEPVEQPEEGFALSQDWFAHADADAPEFPPPAEPEPAPLQEAAPVVPGEDPAMGRPAGADLSALSYAELLDRLALAFQRRRERLDALPGGMPVAPLPAGPVDLSPEGREDDPAEEPAVPTPAPGLGCEPDEGERSAGVMDQPEMGWPIEETGPFEDTEAEKSAPGFLPAGPLDFVPSEGDSAEFGSAYDAEWDEWDEAWDDAEGEGEPAPDFAAPRQMITASFAALADCSDVGEEEEYAEEEDGENESAYSSLLDFGHRSRAKEPCLRLDDAEREAAAEALTSHLPDEDHAGEFPGMALVRDCITSFAFEDGATIEEEGTATKPSTDSDFGTEAPASLENEQLLRDALVNLHKWAD